jgi:hypothetical protein
MKCSKCNNVILNEYFEVIVVRYIGKTGRRISEKRYCPGCFDKFGALPTESKKSIVDTSKDSETSKDSNNSQEEIPITVTKV